MIGGKSNPDVVVVGMPSCGKTVFFTVLGKKFTTLIDGRRVAPLGFRMSTCDKGTATVVNAAYDRLRAGNWPEATKAGQMMPLRWEVFTGSRRIFELFSMDIAGETFKRAFDIGDDDGVGKVVGKASQPVMTKQAVVDSGNELYRGDEVSAESETQAMAQTEEGAVDDLKQAIATAKVVCFMVNVALPNGLSGRRGDDSDEKKLLRFRNSVLNMYLSLKERPELRSKTMIVLTQTHLHEWEIERAGGPVMYLGDVCGGEASELCNLVKENNIPVIAVSAINEERDTNELPPIASPDDIPSSGLFGFLLAVAGMVSGDDNLGAVRNAYLAYQRERFEYLKYPSQGVKSRLPQAMKCHAAAVEFVGACERYLENVNNLVEGSGSALLNPSALAMYRQCTRENPEVKATTDKEYLVRDQIWDCALRKAVMLECQKSTAVETREIYDDVLEGMLKSFPDRKGCEEFIYGFGNEDLFPGGEASTFDKWIELNVREYRDDFKDTIGDLSEAKNETIKVIDALEGYVGEKRFIPCLALVKKQYDEFVAKMSEFRSAWLGDGSIALSKAQCMEEEVAKKYNRVSEYEREHARREEEEKNRLIREEMQRREKAAADHRRRVVIVTLLLVLTVGAALLFGGHYYHDERNKRIRQEIEDAISLSSDYQRARRLYDSLSSVNWLGVSRADYLCPSFTERLGLAEKYSGIRKSLDGLKSKLDGLCKWLNGKSSEEINKAQRQCDAASKGYKELPRSMSFTDIVNPKVDLNARILQAKVCETEMASAIKVTETLRDGWDEKLRKEKFGHEVESAKKLLEKIDAGIGDYDLVAVSNCVKDAKLIVGNLKILAGSHEADKGKVKEIQGELDEVWPTLENKLAELRHEQFAKMLADVRSAMASKSVDEVWEEFDGISGSPLNDGERMVLSNLEGEIKRFTVKSYERDLSEATQTVGEICSQTSISADLIGKMRESLKKMDNVLSGLRRRIPEGSDDFNRIESLVKKMHEDLPIVVQIDGIDTYDDNRPVDIRNMRNIPAAMNGISPETQKRCVYLLILRNELPSGSSRFLRVVDAKGKTHGVSINLSYLVPGINRFEKPIN